MIGNNPGAGLLALRLVLGLLFLCQGLGKLLGAPFPGEGIDALAESMAFLFPQLGAGGGKALAFVFMLLQVGGGLLLIVGWQTKIITALLIVQVVVAIARVRLWMGLFHPLGWEVDLVEATALLCLLLGGPGMYSMDGRRKAPKEGAAAA